MKRTRRTLEQWLELYEQWQESGLSAPVYCKSSGISYQSFQNFRSKFEKGELNISSASEEVSEIPAFIDLGSLSNMASGRDSGWNITLRLGNGVELELSQAS